MDINFEEYGQIVRKVFQAYGISSPQSWEEIGAKRRQPHTDAAKSVIRALIDNGLLVADLDVDTLAELVVAL